MSVYVFVFAFVLVFAFVSVLVLMLVLSGHGKMKDYRNSLNHFGICYWSPLTNSQASDAGLYILIVKSNLFIFYKCVIQGYSKC